MQFNALTLACKQSPSVPACKATNMAREINRNGEAFSRLHHNLLKNTLVSFSDSNFSCDTFVRFANARLRRESEAYISKGSVLFISSMLRIISRLGYFWADDIYDILVGQSKRIVAHQDTRAISKTLWAVATAGRAKRHEKEVREMWESAMKRGDELQDGNLRELYHTKLLAEVEVSCNIFAGFPLALFPNAINNTSHATHYAFCRA